MTTTPAGQAPDGARKASAIGLLLAVLPTILYVAFPMDPNWKNFRSLMYLGWFALSGAYVFLMTRGVRQGKAWAALPLACAAICLALFLTRTPKPLQWSHIDEVPEYSGTLFGAAFYLLLCVWHMSGQPKWMSNAFWQSLLGLASLVLDLGLLLHFCLTNLPDRFIWPLFGRWASIRLAGIALCAQAVWFCRWGWRLGGAGCPSAD